MDFKSLGEALFTHHQDSIKLKQDESGFRVDGKIVTPEKILDYVSSTQLKDNLHINPEDVALKHKKEIYKAFLKVCVKELSESKIPEEISEISLGRDRCSGNIFLFDKGRITNVDFRGWKQQYPKAAPILLSEAFEFVAEYNPHKPSKWLDSQYQAGYIADKIIHYNTYFIPTWQRLPEPATLECDFVKNYLKPFFEHLFPDEKSRSYVKWWLYKLSKERCQDCLILVGGRGTGKTMLVNLARGLVGETNFKKASKKLLSKEFNSEFSNSRLVALEETRVTESGYELIKKYMDTNIAVEAKGADPIQVTNYASIILTNNIPRKVHCLYDERRYSCPDLTDKSLTSVWSEEKIDRFEKMFLNDKEFQTTFAHWLKSEVKEMNHTFPKNKPFITDTFWKLVDASKHPAWKSILHLLKTKEFINVEDVTWRGVNGRKISNSEIEEWIEMEALERERRETPPHTVLKSVVEDGIVNYKNLVLE